jgi:endo-1,4-beta-mannosidase
MGKWIKDDDIVPFEENISTNELFNEGNLKRYIKDLDFNGYISMIDNLSQYTVFNPDKYVEILKLSF